MSLYSRITRWVRAARKRPRLLGCIALASVLLGVAAIRTNALWGLSTPLRLVEQLPSPAGATTAVVVVHGYTGSIASMRDVVHVVRGSLPTARVYSAEYPAQVFSNLDPLRAASELDTLLDETRRDHPEIEKIILIGYSSGALLARKALAFGLGSRDDQPGQGSVQKGPSRWTALVDRMVLLAGMNRGWDPGAEVGTGWRIINRAGILVARSTGTGRYIRALQRGSPFVANLRLQWLELHRTQKLPMVVQLLGDDDVMVTPEDDRDIGVAKGFVFYTIAGANHANLIRMNGDTPERERRAHALRDALSLSHPESGVMAARSASQSVDPGVTDLVFIMHGIRDHADWTTRLGATIERDFASLHAGSARRVRIELSGYGYFPMLPFLLWQDRQTNVRWFVDRYTEALAACPNAESIHFIGHSNGTYLLGCAMRAHPLMRFDRVALGGSVLPTSYQWDPNRVGEVKNFLASDDAVVALFPMAFEKAGLGDLGGAGFNGFTSDASRAKSGQVAYLKGGHGRAFEEDHFGAISAFVLKGAHADASPTPSALATGLYTTERPGWLVTLSNLSAALWVVAPVLVLCLVAGPTCGARWLFRASRCRRFATASVAAIVSLLIFFILRSI